MGGKRKMNLDQAINYYDKMAYNARMHGMWEESKRFEEKSRKLRKEQSDRKMKTVDGRREIAREYDKLGDIEKEKREIARARKYYMAGAEIRRILVNEVGTPEVRRDLFMSYSKLAAVAEAENNRSEQLYYYKKMLKICLALKKERHSAQDYIDLQYCYYNLGVYYFDSGCDQEKSRRMLRSVIRISKKCSDPRAQRMAEFAKRWIGYSLKRSAESSESMGDKARAHGMLEEAENYYRRNLEQISSKQGRRMTKDRMQISGLYRNLGDIARKQGRFEEALRCYEGSSEANREIMRELETDASRRNYAISLERVGDLARDCGKFELARDYFERSLEVRMQALRINDSVKNRHGMLLIYNRLADVIELLGLMEEAEDYCNKALDYATLLAGENPTEPALMELQACYHSLGMMLFTSQKDVDRAKELFRKIISISEENEEFTKLEKLAEEVRVML